MYNFPTIWWDMMRYSVSALLSSQVLRIDDDDRLLHFHIAHKIQVCHKTQPNNMSWLINAQTTVDKMLDSEEFFATVIIVNVIA